MEKNININVQVDSKPLDDLKNKITAVEQSADEMTKGTVENMKNFAKVGSGIAGAFQTALGSMQLLGVENENVVKSIQKLQAVMALTQGFNAISDGVEGFARLKDSIDAAKKEGTLFNNVMKASVIGAIAAVVMYLVNNFDELRKRFTWIDTAATALEGVWSGLMGVFENGIDVLKNVGKVVLTALVAPIKTYIDTLKGVGKILKAVFEGDFDSIPDIAKETAEDIKKNFTDVGDAAVELGDTVATSYKAGLTKAAEEQRKANSQMTEEQRKAAEEARKQRLAEQAELAEELRVAKLSDRQKELDDLEKWYKESRAKAHENQQLLLALDEEYRKQKQELQAQWDAEDAEAAQAKAEEEAEAELQRIKDEQARKQAELAYLQESGQVSDEEGLLAQIELEEEKLALLEEGTAEYYNQLTALEKLKKQYKKTYSAAAKEQEAAAAKTEKVTSAMDKLNAVNDAIQSVMAAVTSGMDQESEEYKAIATTMTIIQGIVGIATALSGAFTEKSGPWDIAIAAIQAAAIAASTAAAVAQINSADENSASSLTSLTTSGGSAVAENAVQDAGAFSSQTSTLPEENTQADTQVYVTTTDINKSQKTLSKKQTQVKF